MLLLILTSCMNLICPVILVCSLFDLIFPAHLISGSNASNCLYTKCYNDSDNFYSVLHGFFN